MEKKRKKGGYLKVNKRIYSLSTPFSSITRKNTPASSTSHLSSLTRNPIRKYPKIEQYENKTGMSSPNPPTQYPIKPPSQPPTFSTAELLNQQITQLPMLTSHNPPPTRQHHITQQLHLTSQPRHFPRFIPRFFRLFRKKTFELRVFAA